MTDTGVSMFIGASYGDHYTTPSPNLLQVIIAQVNGKGSVPKLSSKAKEVTLDATHVQSLSSPDVIYILSPLCCVYASTHIMTMFVVACH